MAFRYFRCKYAHQDETVNTQINMLTSIHFGNNLFNDLHFTSDHNYCLENLSPTKICKKGKRKGNNLLLHDENSFEVQ